MRPGSTPSNGTARARQSVGCPLLLCTCPGRPKDELKDYTPETDPRKCDFAPQNQLAASGRNGKNPKSGNTVADKPRNRPILTFPRHCFSAYTTPFATSQARPDSPMPTTNLGATEQHEKRDPSGRRTDLPPASDAGQSLRIAQRSSRLEPGQAGPRQTPPPNVVTYIVRLSSGSMRTR